MMKLYFLLAALAAASFLSTSIYSQRDYFSPEEVEIIRDAQQIDARVNVLTHIVDRRFAALGLDVQAPPLNKKDKSDWGSAPTGSRIELLIDIKRILQKAVDDIDNLSERPTSIVVEEDVKDKKKKQPGFAELFPVAVRSLAGAAARYQPVLKVQLDQTKDESERGAILDSLELCDEIAASVGKLPAAAAPVKAKD